MCGHAGHDGNDKEVRVCHASLPKIYSVTKKGIKNVIITLGEKGCYFANKKENFFIKAFKFKDPVIDTTGAGDLYAGGFLKGLADGLKPELSAKIGSICAGQIVTQLGSRSNTDLLNLINSHLEA